MPTSHAGSAGSAWCSDLNVVSLCGLCNNSSDRHWEWSGHGAEGHGENEEADDGGGELHFDGLGLLSFW